MKRLSYLFQLEVNFTFVLFFVTLAFPLNVLAAEYSVPGWPKYRLRGANVLPKINEEDLNELVKWNANSVRILHEKVMSNEPPYLVYENAIEEISKVTNFGLKHGLYVVIAPVVSFDDHDAFFGNKEFRASYVELWRRIAKMYKDNPGGVAYDLTNEPHDERAKVEWQGYAEELTRAIREIDKEHVIIVEPTGWGWPNLLAELKPTGDPRTVYSFHFYGPMDFTHLRGYNSEGKYIGHLKVTEEEWKKRKYPGFMQKENWNKKNLALSLAKAFEFRDKYKVPVWCGEFGVTRWAIGAKEWAGDLIDVMEKEKVGWAYYSFREPEWHAMDIEMDPNVRDQPTPRSETEMVKLFKSYFRKNQKPNFLR